MYIILRFDKYAKIFVTQMRFIISRHPLLFFLKFISDECYAKNDGLL